METSARVAATVVALFGIASSAQAECLDHDRARWVIQQSLVMLLNPMGMEHNARIGLCAPLYASDDPVLAQNHVEAGVSTYVSPIYFVPGGYLQLAPASFLFIRAELSALTIWPLPLSGAGFYERSSYDQGWHQDDLPADGGGGATGFSMRVMAVLRGRVDVAPGLAIVAFDAGWVDLDVLDRGAFWVDVRDDLIAAQSDWILANEGVLLLEATIPGGTALRFGAYSALRAVPASGYVGHQLGPIAMLSIPRFDTHVAGLDLFIRLGVYTHHGERVGEAATMLGLAAAWDLGSL